MPKVSNDEIRWFAESIAQATTRLGGGKVGVSGDRIRSIVHEQRDAAYRYVELQLIAAASQPGYLQPAAMVAAAIQIEFGDEGPMRQIEQRARELEAPTETWMPGASPDLETARREASGKRGDTDREAIRMLNSSSEDLESGRTDHLFRVFSEVSDLSSDAKRLRGTVALGFPSYDEDPRPNYTIAAIRSFVRKLDRQLPHFPYFLVPDRASEQVLVYLLCLVDLKTLEPPSYSPADLLVVARKSAEHVSRFCLKVGDDPERASEPLLLNLPTQILKEFPELALKALRSMAPVLKAMLPEVENAGRPVPADANAAQHRQYLNSLLRDASALAGLEAAQFPTLTALLKAILARVG